MNTQEAYNQWAPLYDGNVNKTRDVEAFALRQTLEDIRFKSCLEIGCGTGKNTLWLAEKADVITAVDLSEEMLAIAQQKVHAAHVNFIQEDIIQDWNFTKYSFDLITFSLVLEHIENLNLIFKKAIAALEPGGYIYIGELHPCKQYNGSKAWFRTTESTTVVECFNHHLSDFLKPAKQYGLHIEKVEEYFDDEQLREEMLRILSILLKKPLKND